MVPLYRLNEIERRLIVSWNLCADISVREIAQRADIREHKIRHALESLVRNGILVPSFLIDNYRLGYSDYGIFFSPSAETSVSRQAFENQMLADSRIAWLARMSGTFQYGATFMAKQPHDVVDFFETMQPATQGSYAKKTLRIGVDCTWFSPNYLAPDVSSRDSVSVTSREGTPPLDSVDHAILVAMARYPASSTAHLARSTGMNASSLAYRLQKLRELGVVRGRMYSINTARLGVLMYRVMILNCGLTEQDRKKLQSLCARNPNVVAFVVCTGSWDYELRFETEHPQLLDEFCQHLIDTFGQSIGSVKVSQQLSTLKRFAYPEA